MTTCDTSSGIIARSIAARFCQAVGAPAPVETVLAARLEGIAVSFGAGALRGQLIDREAIAALRTVASSPTITEDDARQARSLLERFR